MVQFHAWRRVPYRRRVYSTITNFVNSETGMDIPFEFNSRRSVVVCRNGCVASSNPLASQIGLDILKAGGNAADAAIAVAAALNVMEPTSTGLGGDAFCMFYDSCSKTVKGLNGSGRSAAATSLERLSAEGYDKTHHYSTLHGHSVTVPGAASAWVDTVSQFGSKKETKSASGKLLCEVYEQDLYTLLEHYQSSGLSTAVLSLLEILRPAIELAEVGFPVQEITAAFWARGAHLLQRKDNIHGSNLLLNGNAPRHGDIMRNQFLADTLKELGVQGKKGFYEGRIAKAVAAVVQQHGGLISYEDLAAHESTFVDPISVDYKGCRIWELPPNGQGMVALMALNILEGFDLKSMGHNSKEYLHHLIESMRLAFADAMQYCADSSLVDIPVEKLLSKDYAAEQRSRILPDRIIPASNLQTSGLDLPVGSDTVYFATADKEGNACSFINSNYLGFGTGLVPEGCGFTLQNRGHAFSLDPNHRNVLAPRKRPYHTLIPSMVTSVDTNDLLMTFGVMGGVMQPQGHVQVLLNMLEFQNSPQAALDLPRICIGTGYGSTSEILTGTLLEKGIPKDTIHNLSDLGHITSEVSGLSRATFGRGQVISCGSWWRDGLENSVTTTLWAGSDPRADGIVAAY